VLSPPTAAGMQGTALGRGALYLDEPAHNLGCVAVRVSHYALATVLARRRRDRETRAERARRRTQSDERSDVATTRRCATFDAWLRDSRRRWLQASRSKTTRRSERAWCEAVHATQSAKLPRRRVWSRSELALQWLHRELGEGPQQLPTTAWLGSGVRAGDSRVARARTSSLCATTRGCDICVRLAPGSHERLEACATQAEVLGTAP
jgi:hypothetical protein